MCVRCLDKNGIAIGRLPHTGRENGGIVCIQQTVIFINDELLGSPFILRLENKRITNRAGGTIRIVGTVFPGRFFITCFFAVAWFRAAVR